MEVDAKRRRDVKSEPEAELKEDKVIFLLFLLKSIFSTIFLLKNL